MEKKKQKKQSPYLHHQEEWKSLYNQGMSYREIGKRSGVAYSTVKTVLRGVVEPRPKQQYAHLSKEWAKLYEEGYSSNEIAEKYQVTTNTVTKYLKEEGVELRRKVERERAFDTVADTWVTMYESGKSLKDIADEFDTYPQTVHKYIRERTDMRWYTETSRQYTINETYFDTLDTDEKVYWLGILFSSGSIINDITGGGIQLSMSAKDRDRVEAFQAVMRTDKPIQERVNEELGNHQVFLRIHNKHLYETVQSYGLQSDKTLTMEFPEHIPANRLSAFLLGYFEGKGSVYNQQGITKGKKYWATYLHIWGTDSFLDTFRTKMKELLDVNFYYTHHQQSNWAGSLEDSKIECLNLGKREEIGRFAEWLYEGKMEYSHRRDIRTYLQKVENEKEKGR